MGRGKLLKKINVCLGKNAKAVVQSTLEGDTPTIMGEKEGQWVWRNTKGTSLEKKKGARLEKTSLQPR